MRVTIEPGGVVAGRASVPGDKSIAHRWLILAATATGVSELRDVPHALDIRSTEACLSALAPWARAALEGPTADAASAADAQGFTFNNHEPRGPSSVRRIEGRGRGALEPPPGPLDCGNSGTTMRLLSGILATCDLSVVLDGDASLRTRPMERVAVPLRAMGAHVETTEGHPPVSVRGGVLRGIRYEVPVPSAQVKGAVLLAGLEAEGATTVIEPQPTRDHTERAIAALGGPVSEPQRGHVSVSAFRPPAFDGQVPGDVSSAAFLVAAAAATGGSITLEGVGLNPTRTAFLDVMGRMGVRTAIAVTGTEVGEPVGELRVDTSGPLLGVRVPPQELPLVIDEVPVLAALASLAEGETTFHGAGELRVKESDRLVAIVEMIRGLGGETAIDGDDLVVAGGGLRGGSARARGDHRMAMSACVAALGARSSVEVEGIESADVSFPGFVRVLRALGVRVGG